MKLKLKELFNIHSGVSGLTERFIYENNPSSVDDSIFVYSGSTNESTQFPSVSKKSIPENKIFNIDNIFIVARNGQAGQITIPKGKFTINLSKLSRKSSNSLSSIANSRMYTHYFKSGRKATPLTEKGICRFTVSSHTESFNIQPSRYSQD